MPPDQRWEEPSAGIGDASAFAERLVDRWRFEACVTLAPEANEALVRAISATLWGLRPTTTADVAIAVWAERARRLLGRIVPGEALSPMQAEPFLVERRRLLASFPGSEAGT